MSASTVVIELIDCLVGDLVQNWTLVHVTKMADSSSVLDIKPKLTLAWLAYLCR